MRHKARQSIASVCIKCNAIVAMSEHVSCDHCLIKGRFAVICVLKVKCGAIQSKARVSDGCDVDGSRRINSIGAFNREVAENIVRQSV